MHWLGSVCGLLVAAALAAAPTHPVTSLKPEVQPWLSSLAEGLARSQQRGQPVLVRVGGESCPWCRKLETEMAGPDAQKELARWTLVALDADKAPEDARRLGVTGIPALRILTGLGAVVASQDGYLPADKLIGWLQEHHEAAGEAPAAELTAAGKPTPLAVVRLIGELKRREPTLREAALRRLLAHPDVAAQPVAEAFLEGNLQTRVAALELLGEWQAPVKELDPWRPETLTQPRLEALKAWAREAGRLAPKAAALTDEQLAAVRQELARMLEASDADAAAARERLARFGRALLPEVQTHLRTAATDRGRERLTALRYRLVASDALVLRWPGGLERLAALTTATRHQAAQELAGRATSDDEPLLLELFSDPDPLVREICLRAIHDLVGPGATAALTRLLQDPDSNVRAAVLKQLAEHPSAGMATRVVDYLATEKDPDLVVHAARVLRSAAGKTAVECLRSLLQHDSWRVRAEAAESLGEIFKDEHTYRYSFSVRGGGADKWEEQRADTYVAMIHLLSDSDGFVVSRAVQALRNANLVASVEPLVQAAQQHPDLAAAVVQSLTGGSNLHARAIPHLRDFCKHPKPEVRAAAIAGLCDIALDDSEKQLRAALQDPETTVRRAAARAFFEELKSSLPTRSDPVELPSATKDMEQDQPPEAAQETENPDASLEKLRQGKGRPEWYRGLIELLRPLLTAPSAEERLAGAQCLIALDQREQALPVLLATAQATPALQGEAGAVLPWLSWTERQIVFNQLLRLEPSPELLADIVQHFAQHHDPRAVERLWELAAQEGLHDDALTAAYTAFCQLYFGQSYYNREETTAARRKLLAGHFRPHAEKGSETERLLGLALLLSASFDDAAAAAEQILADPQASAALRRDAFQTQLLTLPKKERERERLKGLAHAEPALRELALGFLVEQPSYRSGLRDGQLYVYLPSVDPDWNPSAAGGRPIVPEAPRGLTPEMVRPFLQHGNPRVRAHAGYLLARWVKPTAWRRCWRTGAARSGPTRPGRRLSTAPSRP